MAAKSYRATIPRHPHPMECETSRYGWPIRIEPVDDAPKIEARLIDYPEAAFILGISIKALEKRVARVDRGHLPKGCIVRTGRRVQFVRARLIKGGEDK